MKIKNKEVLYISTRVWVLHTPNASWNLNLTSFFCAEKPKEMQTSKKFAAQLSQKNIFFVPKRWSSVIFSRNNLFTLKRWDKSAAVQELFSFLGIGTKQFWPAFGVRSTRMLVEICNKEGKSYIQFEHRIDYCWFQFFFAITFTKERGS